jgi:hypothetical protein
LDLPFAGSLGAAPENWRAILAKANRMGGYDHAYGISKSRVEQGGVITTSIEFSKLLQFGYQLNEL